MITTSPGHEKLAAAARTFVEAEREVDRLFAVPRVYPSVRAEAVRRRAEAWECLQIAAREFAGIPAKPSVTVTDARGATLAIADHLIPDRTVDLGAKR